MPERSRLFEGCRFDESDGRLSGPASDEPITLRPQAARLLLAFLDRPGEVLNREHLCAAVWDEGAVVDFESGLAALMRELRQALDAIGAGAQLIETVPRRGYRFLGAIDNDLSDAGSADGANPPAPPASSRKPTLILAAVLILGLLAGLLWWLSDDRGTATAQNPTLAIMPFELYSENDQADRRLRLLVADSLLARLWEVELTELDLIGRAALKPYQDRDDQARAVAEDLGVSLLLEGSIIRSSAESWQVDARLLAMPRGTILWSASVPWDAHSELPVMPSVDELVADLAGNWPDIRSSLRQASD